MFLQETYEVEDCNYYNPTTYSKTGSGARVETLSINSLPNNYILTYEDYYTKTANAYLIIGTDDNHRVTFGTVDNANYKMWVNNNTSSATKLSTNEYKVDNTWIEHSLTVENGKVTFKNVDSTNTGSINLQQLWRLIIFEGSNIRNIKVKAL